MAHAFDNSALQRLVNRFAADFFTFKDNSILENGADKLVDFEQQYLDSVIQTAMSQHRSL